MHIIHRLCLPAVFILLLAAGCKKDDSPAAGTANDGSTLNYVLKDNFSFDVLYATLDGARLLDTLGNPGPYTILAPDNGAFALLGIRTPLPNNNFATLGTLFKPNLLYSMLPGRIAVSSMPLNTAQACKSGNGGHVYIKRYLDGTDTVTTVNGFRITSTDNPASNGLIQVVPQVLNPEIYATTAAELRGDPNTGLFAAAMLRAGLTDLLSGNDEYTVLAPSDAAFQQAAIADLNISTLDDILQADPVKLAALLKYHIVKGRYFEGDLYLDAKSNPDGISMLDGGKVKIGGNSSGYKAITFLGNGNGGVSAGILSSNLVYLPPNYANIPCGNGVIHIINRVLIP